ncbi:MAG TPA: lytic murein transglycosylase, partial [Immundisolibacter sp.]|nr:lytic murein transglycosylase [Immundisolibacter sp.]
EAGQPISAVARVTPAAAGLADGNPSPRYTLSELRQEGVAAAIDSSVPASLKAAVIRLDGEQGDEYHLGFQNFYAITRYNHSPLYAMAVTQLAAAIGAQHPAAP